MSVLRAKAVARFDDFEQLKLERKREIARKSDKKNYQKHKAAIVARTNRYREEKKASMTPEEWREYRRNIKRDETSRHPEWDINKRRKMGMAEQGPFETQEKQDAFISAYSNIGITSVAAKAVHVPLPTVMGWKRDNEAFAERMAQAKLESQDYLEGVARQRAIAGSDRLLIFLLRGYKPETFGQRVDVHQYIEVEVAKMAAEYGRDKTELMQEVDQFLAAQRTGR